MLSALFVSFWGLFQFFCNVTGFPYPDYIFNNSGSVSGRGFLETLNGVGRVSSATLEPSVLAQDIVTVLPLTLAAWLGRGSVLSVSIDRFSTVLFIVLLAISTSSTAYLSLLVLGASSLLVLLRTDAISLTRALKIAVIGAGAAATIILFSVFSVPIVREILSSALVDKSSSGSALERLMTVQLAFGYFQKYPLLGVGWGSATSHDLIVMLLSNVGIFGAVAFFAALYVVLRANWRALDSFVLPADLSRSAWFLSLLMFLFTSVIDGFPLALGNFWLVLGMAISTSWKAYPDRECMIVSGPLRNQRLPT
jgi:O-antigen ligase